MGEATRCERRGGLSVVWEALGDDVWRRADCDERMRTECEAVDSHARVSSACRSLRPGQQGSRTPCANRFSND